MPDPIHHLHKRKRIHEKHEQYPHPQRLKRVVDRLIYVVGVFVPAMTALQSIKIWIEKDASGIALITWAGYAVCNLIWILYGVLHKENPIIFMYILLFFFNTSIVLGTLIYG
jgi:uncharacterized protein with PQ loop repeat